MHGVGARGHPSIVDSSGRSHEMIDGPVRRPRSNAASDGMNSETRRKRERGIIRVIARNKTEHNSRFDFF